MKYIVKFKRTMVAEVEVTADDETDAEERFEKGEWDDHYHEVEIKTQTVLSIKAK